MKTHCLNCGHFIVAAGRAHAKKYCSTNCAIAYRRKPSVPINLVVASRYCPTCNELIIPSERYPEKKFCNERCRNKSYRRKKARSAYTFGKTVSFPPQARIWEKP